MLARLSWPGLLGKHVKDAHGLAWDSEQKMAYTQGKNMTWKSQSSIARKTIQKLRHSELVMTIYLFLRPMFKRFYQEYQKLLRLRGVAYTASSYQRFVALEKQRLQFERKQYELEIVSFPDKPVISVVMPVYKTSLALLMKAVDSVRQQIYPYWEFCIVDDGSQDTVLEDYLYRLSGTDSRIKISLRKSNGNISVATNESIALSTGPWIAFLDHDDELSQDALFQVAYLINQQADCDIIYTDQDKIDVTQKRSEPFFKPDWSPEYLCGVMYFGHLLVVRRTLIERYGGCDSRFDTVQDFELALRLSEHTNRIAHIPLVLYHWRAIPGSVAADSSAKPNVSHLQELAVQEHLDRLGIPARACRKGSEHRLQMVPKPRSWYPKISILIPTRDHPELLGPCLKTVFENTTYSNFEVVIGDNETQDPEALKIMQSYPVVVVKLPGEFHFARFNNVLAAQAGGEYLVLLNNDTEVLQKDWLEHLLLYAEQDSVGAVGPLLIYADGSVQHAGVILGPRGTADHLMRGFPGECDGYMGSLACSHEVTAVTGACLMIRKDKYVKVGGLNERFRRHYEDVDFCLRLRKHGWRNIFVASVRLIHHESKSRGQEYNFTDRVLLLDQWEALIDRGDEYYNANFDKNCTDYRLRVKGGALSRLRAKGGAR